MLEACAVRSSITDRDSFKARAGAEANGGGGSRLEVAVVVLPSGDNVPSITLSIGDVIVELDQQIGQISMEES